ncbi:4Fe-4S dicluster domain-containing protein [Hymenobacter taeanensis]|uniref:4Fe-4S dicluster domain-containing protein n=1 Tax=Hymenobacter taeanensis TaxID=2735321 RepID=A0A6M6BIH3_9BACT|nr:MULTISPECIES: 4Fe-4S dicluster domain-containing protein [Hymenobacter]QJX46855.1 4Fe-4S dicluster domain-containing protein [Hymenobacter taeanensis]UOQ80727.1 4Fe-4S dicluster domain-containing protein [Hymenobacter sp. 5414T-23]
MHFSIQNILFLLVAVAGFGLFAWQVRKIQANILVGRDRDMSGNVNERLSKTLLVAFGQQKMFKRLTPAILHLIVYVGFIVINIEVIEILIDGLFGTHRVLQFLGPLYSALTGTNEILGALVIVAVAAFWWRRNVKGVRRFSGPEMRAWSKLDANVILYVEVILMAALFTMNAADLKLHQVEGRTLPGAFPISSLLTGIFPDNTTALEVLERIGWWAHIVGILLFLNYLPSSKHFHIIMAFPNVYYSRLVPQGQFSNVESITHEVKAMMDPSYEVPAPAVGPDGSAAAPTPFGAKDVDDLAWTNLLNAYSCTECGRCTSVCPANLTGKLLSPRKIIMDTRDRMEEKYNSPLIFNPNLYGKEAKHDTQEQLDAENHTLLRGYVTPEELWACTTCNACVEACPVNINPLESIVEMRRFLVLEESAAPNSLNVMFSNIENNGAPWAFSPSDRFNWADDLYVADKATTPLAG